MALVGDVVMEMRSMGPDVPQVSPAPAINTLAASGSGGTFATGTVYVQVTVLTTYGETLPSVEASVSVTGPTASVSLSVSGAYVGAKFWRVYYAMASGQESFYEQFPFTASTQTLVIINTPLAAQTPPVRSTAFNPDTDGGFVGAFVAFRWLNEALEKAALLTGGIQDWGGAGSVANQPMYRPATAVWRKFDACWYDGWELEQGNKAEIFRNKPITASISRIFAMDVNSAGQVVELYYIPSRTSAQTTTSAPFNPGDTTVTLTSAVGFNGPPFGLVQIGSEVCFFSSVTGNQLIGLTRGLSGTTVPTAAVASGAAVTELNILWNGYRMPVAYSPGQSSVTLDVPQGWRSILPKYLLAKFREAEQSRQEATSLFKEFEAEFKTLAYSNRQLAGPRQARIFDSFGFRGVIPASAGGGLIIR